MKVAIHQPNFVPWLGFFYKLSLSDLFILLDNAQYTKNSFINRNRIKTPQGVIWLTLPVITSGKFGQSINEVTIKDFDKTKKVILNTLKMNYSKAKFFDLYITDIEIILNNSINNLAHLNIEFIYWICKILDINVKILKASEIGVYNVEGTSRLVEICKRVGASVYLSGFGGNNYQEVELFDAENIQVVTYDFKHPSYEQLWGDFISNLSILDLIFNCGQQSKNILMNRT